MLTTFRQFDTSEESEAVLLPLLRQAGIPFEVAEEFPPVLAGFREANPAKKVAVRLDRADFIRAENLLVRKAVLEALTDAEPDHYLFDFTTDELVEIVRKPDEWSAFDVILTRQILHQRGVTVSDEQMQGLVQERFRTLATHEKPSAFWLAVGFVLALLGGLGGVLIGLNYANDKKRLPNGQHVFAYDETTRRKGRLMLRIGGAVFGLLVLAGLVKVAEVALLKWGLT
jgi:hypothetical protein